MKTNGSKSIGDINELLKTKDSDFWVALGRKNSLSLFHQAAEKVPAYKDFLKKNKIVHKNIKSWSDFQKVPITNKKNYLRRYPLEKLCWGGKLDKPFVFTATSGSTGLPVYFPRTDTLEKQYSTTIESFLINSKTSQKQSTLVVVCFGMGVWIGGLLTYKAFESTAKRLNLPLSIITPGINKSEIFNALKNLAPHYGELVLVGYPPFIKDIVDEAPSNGVNLKRIKLKFLFAAESFTENFRDYLKKNTGIKSIYNDMMNIYGSADIGAMAHETGVSILIKRLALKNQKLFNSVFSNINKTPTLAQFNPAYINFESINNEIALTGDSAIPLIRYAIGDNGGIKSYDEIEKIFKENKLNFAKIKKGIIKNDFKLPFVYVYERNDFSTKLYGAIIYPEHIREVLHEKQFGGLLSGKFVMITKFDRNTNEYLEVNIELKAGKKVADAISKRLVKSIVQNLNHKNAEYHNNHKIMPKRVEPRLIFWPNGDPEHFKSGIKQKWIKN